MCQCLQFIVKGNQFDIISAIKSSFVEKSKYHGLIIGYTYSKSRSFIDNNGQEWFRFLQPNGCWDHGKEPDAVRYKYRLHVDVKRNWQRYFSTGSGIEFVFSSKKNAERNLKRLKRAIDVFSQTGKFQIM